MADQRRSADRPLVSADGATTTDREGRRHEHVRTDAASWEAMLDAAAAGKGGDEIYAAGQAAVSTSAADAEEAERLVREIMGAQYRPLEDGDR